ncbi:unnamed protein product [Porites lobata]|uniref:Uncharacterized protein n=1 Tax=Porites lobata TaxID=104759 RepID=A0ABN8MWE1_9CNID|nr:unnamed protein product [Porites lobata]
MFLRIFLFFFLVVLTSCSETKKDTQDSPPGLLQALRSKYLGHIRGKRTDSADSDPPDLKEALGNAYFGHIRGKRTDSEDYPPLGEALNTAYLGHIRGKRTLKGWGFNPALREAFNKLQFYGPHLRGKRTGGWESNKDLLEVLNNAYSGHIRGKRQQDTSKNSQ